MKKKLVTATAAPVPREGTQRLMVGGKDQNSIYPGQEIEVPWTAYYIRRHKAGELRVIDAKRAPKGKE